MTQLLREHLALALTGAVFVTLGLRVLAATRGNFSSALALLQNADPVEVVVGMGIQLLPLVPLVVGAILISVQGSEDRIASHGDARRAMGLVSMVGGLALVMAALLVPNRTTALVGIGVGVVIVLLGWSVWRAVWPTPRTGADDGRWITRLRRSGQGAAVFTGVVYLVLALSPTMWLPREVIDRRGSSSVVGYVLSADSVNTVVMTSHARRVVIIDTDNVGRRRVCELERRDRPLLFGGLGGEDPDYRRCTTRESRRDA